MKANIFSTVQDVLSVLCSSKLHYSSLDGLSCNLLWLRFCVPSRSSRSCAVNKSGVCNLITPCVRQYVLRCSLLHVFIKGKAVPLQAWSGREGSRKLKFPDFVTTAQDGGKIVSLTHRPPLPPPGKAPGTHFC